MTTPPVEKTKPFVLNSFPIWAVHRPVMDKKFRTEQGKHDWWQWVKTVEDSMARFEQWEGKMAGKVNRQHWDRTGELLQELKFMRRMLREWAMKEQAKREPTESVNED